MGAPAIKSAGPSIITLSSSVPLEIFHLAKKNIKSPTNQNTVRPLFSYGSCTTLIGAHFQTHTQLKKHIISVPEWFLEGGPSSFFAEIIIASAWTENRGNNTS